MQSRVYRNLDVPFRIFGLNAVEIIFLCIFLVGGGEIASLFELNRSLVFVLAVFIAAILAYFHRVFGERMGARLIRFLRLPHQFSPRLMSSTDRGLK